MTTESFPQKESFEGKTQRYLEILKREKQKSLQEIKTLKERNFDEPVSGDDFPSTQQSRVRNEELLITAQERLQEIEKTIAWVEGEGHGFICQVCGKEIEDKRLNADVASVTCLEHLDHEDDNLSIRTVA